jgi:hypothetical protein
MANIRESYLPPCIIHISTNFKEVRWVEMNIPFVIRVKEDDSEKKYMKRCELLLSPVYKHYSYSTHCRVSVIIIHYVSSHDSLDFRDLHQFKNFKECCSRMMTDFIERVCLATDSHLAVE